MKASITTMPLLVVLPFAICILATQSTVQSFTFVTPTRNNHHILAENRFPRKSAQRFNDKYLLKQKFAKEDSNEVMEGGSSKTNTKASEVENLSSNANNDDGITQINSSDLMDNTMPVPPFTAAVILIFSLFITFAPFFMADL